MQEELRQAQELIAAKKAEAAAAKKAEAAQVPKQPRESAQATAEGAGLIQKVKVLEKELVAERQKVAVAHAAS